ncbi:MAG: hypothetical protein AAFQ89_10175 [Cyanobacteria bacterium J06626_18]
MSDAFPLAPRYRLDDNDNWLVGVDPLRRYWLAVNGDRTLPVIIPGLNASSFDAFREAVLAFRDMRPGEAMEFPTAIGLPFTLQCVSKNCFLVSGDVNGFPASHLLDQEALESLLMTAHPDWRCAPHHEELGRQMLSLAWDKPAAAKVA